jgi:hypothetical protein
LGQELAAFSIRAYIMRKTAVMLQSVIAIEYMLTHITYIVLTTAISVALADEIGTPAILRVHKLR